jgi:hypothetical protein
VKAKILIEFAATNETTHSMTGFGNLWTGWGVLRIRALSICSLVCTLLWASAVSAQSNYAVLSGVVLDPQQHATPDVYEFLRNNVLDARTFNEMGSNHLVRNNFGGSLGGPIVRNQTFFFGNFEGLRHSKSDTMIATVPTADEIAGDFSMSGVTIYNPFSVRQNPAFDPSKPVSPANPQIIRDPFPDNRIPADLMNPAASLFAQKYLPRPNLDMGMMGCGMTMMGTPQVVGAGFDCNNYLDVRTEHHTTNQGTMRVDHLFSDDNTISVRHSLSSERGFMPQNLPGFGALHDNMSQQGNIAWNRVISPRLMNIASIGISRLAMHRSSENSDTNDIVSELGIQGVGFGGKGAYGAPTFSVQGYSAMGDSFAATPMHAWDSTGAVHPTMESFA